MKSMPAMYTQAFPSISVQTAMCFNGNVIDCKQPDLTVLKDVISAPVTAL